MLVIGVPEAVRGAGGDGEGDATGQRAVFAGAVGIGATVGFIIGVAARIARGREGARSEVVAVRGAVALGDAVAGHVVFGHRGRHARSRIDIGAAAVESRGGIVVFRGGILIGAGVGAVAVGIGLLIVIGDRAAVGIDFGEAAGVARSAVEADVCHRAPFGAGVAIGGRRMTGIGLAFDGGPLGGGVGFGQRAGIHLGAGRVAAVVFDEGVGFAGSLGRSQFLNSIKRI